MGLRINILNKDVIKNVRDKIQVSMWVNTPLKHLVDNEDLNLTRFVNDSLEAYFSVSDVKDIDDQIAVKRTEMQSLEQRRRDILSKKELTDARELVEMNALDELRESFAARMENPKSRKHDLGWIESPKNLLRCKALNKDSEEILSELDAWYENEEKNKHSEN